MAPSRTKPQPDDQRSETSSIKEKAASAAASAFNGKSRRIASAVAGSSLRDVTNAPSVNSAPDGANNAHGEPVPGIQWSTFDSMILEGYRYDYRLNTAPAFKDPYNQIVLSRSALGRCSPTMARRPQERRQSKEQLANAVRKHFNGMGIVENEVVVDFLYKVRWQDKKFRMHFPPARHR